HVQVGITRATGELQPKLAAARRDLDRVAALAVRRTRQAGHRGAVGQLVATAAAGVVAGGQALAGERRIAAHHDVVGARLRAGPAAGFVVAGAVGAAVVGRSGRLRTTTHVQVGVTAASGRDNVEVRGARRDGD